MTKKQEKQAKEYIHHIISETTRFCPLIQSYEIVYMDEETNSDNGEFSIMYEPENFAATFYIYKKALTRMPDKGLTEGYKHYLKIRISHEVGHTYLWELEGTEKNIEKSASLIGCLIHEILDSRKL